jgi:hypothetical protein
MAGTSHIPRLKRSGTRTGQTSQHAPQAAHRSFTPFGSLRTVTDYPDSNRAAAIAESPGVARIL